MLNKTMFAKKVYLVWAILLLSGLLAACSSTSAATETVSIDDEKSDYAGKKIVWVNSYHQGYEWSDGIEVGLKDALDNSGAELKVIRLDTKRNTEKAFGANAATKAKGEIEAFEPDVIIATDDNAQKYLIEPYYKDTDMPVVFAAVNWDASVYGFPADNVTGMVEIELVAQMMELLKPYAQGERVGYLGPNIATDQKTASTYNERFFDGNLQTRLVDDLDEFKQAFVEMQDEVDILVIGPPTVFKDWDETAAEEVEKFMLENSRIPVAARHDWVIPYALLTIAKDAAEQGEWAAGAALQILDGTPVSEIPIAENKKGDLIINLDMAENLDIVFPPSVLKNAEIYSSEE